MLGTQFHVRAKAVINATGQFADSVRQLDNKATQPICQPGSGVHIILPDYYWHADARCAHRSAAAAALVACFLAAHLSSFGA